MREERDWVELARSRLGRYRNRHDWDDLLGFCLMEAWAKVAQIPPEERQNERALFVRGLGWAVTEYFRERKSGAERRHTREGHPLPQVVSYDLLKSRGWDRSCGDFAPALIARLERQRVVRTALSGATPRDVWLLTQYYGEGKSFTELSGTTYRAGVRRELEEALGRARERLIGTAEHPTGRHTDTQERWRLEKQLYRQRKREKEKHQQVTE